MAVGGIEMRNFICYICWQQLIGQPRDERFSNYNDPSLRVLRFFRNKICWVWLWRMIVMSRIKQPSLGAPSTPASSSSIFSYQNKNILWSTVEWVARLWPHLGYDQGEGKIIPLVRGTGVSASCQEDTPLIWGENIDHAAVDFETDVKLCMKLKLMIVV